MSEIHAKQPEHSGEAGDRPGLSRRRALARLGLAAAAVYAAPTITRLDREALAKALPSPICPPGRPGCGGGGRPGG